MRNILTVTTLVVLITLLRPTTALAQAPSCEFEYTVQAGDWLSKIADKYYDNVLAYPAIVEANNAQADDDYTDIADPDLIEPGWVLCIPSGGNATSRESASAESSPELVGTVWQWDQTLMNNDDIFVPDNSANYTIQFKPDGTVAIQADCNQAGGTYTLDGSLITIELGPSTMAACPEGSLADRFVAHLSGAAIHFFQGQNLFIDLKFDSGTMRFSPQSIDVVGTNWIVTAYNNGQEAVVSPIPGTEITAFFGPGNNLTGFSGCNTYSGGYEFGDNQTVTIRNLNQPVSNLQTCTEPEGIMEQEQSYLTALSSAAFYELRGDVLQLRTADNTIAVTFLFVPTEMPVEESGSVLDVWEHIPDPNLINKTWGWERRDPNGNQIDEIIVPNPENYTVTFAEDGTFSAKLDCNNASGRYATSSSGGTQYSIFMELGPSQMAFCGEDSLDTTMANMFGPAQNYYYQEDGAVLVFIWVAAGPIDYYRAE